MDTRKIILPSSEVVEINRLVNQAMAWEDEAELLLDKINVQPGWKCADLGCGPIGILRALSLRVGETGHVQGLDSNPVCVQYAQSYIDNNHLNNVEMLQGDLYENDLKPGSFDLVHIRFVFTQIGCDSELLKKSIQLTRPGGFIISQESDWTSWNCYPVNPAWEKVRDALITSYEIKGGDINAGRRTYKMFKEEGFEDIQIRTAILALPVGNVFRSGMNLLARSMRESVLHANILKENEFEDALIECDAILNDPNSLIISYILCQVWGKVK